MSSPSESRCPRCGGGFHCGMHDAAPCACTTVELDAATLAALRERYRDCLCLRCLAQLRPRGAAPGDPAADRPAPPGSATTPHRTENVPAAGPPVAPPPPAGRAR